jgi:hypothetical protein
MSGAIAPVEYVVALSAVLGRSIVSIESRRRLPKSPFFAFND